MTGQTKNRRAPLTKKQRLCALIKVFVFALCLGLMAVLGGFFEFARQVSAQTTPARVPAADGIVVWTGPGGGRLEAGTALLKEGKGERLLISGVNEQNSREDLITLLELSDPSQSCCLDLDYAAVDTIGNAVETVSWAEALGYEHIILVTSDYHMPRAQIEISSRMGRMRITPYPVESDKDGPWWKNKAQFRRLTTEYGKLLLSFMRRPRQGNDTGTAIIVPNMPPQPAAEQPAAEKE